MGWVMMSERELHRIKVLAQVDDGRLSVQNGANLLNAMISKHDNQVFEVRSRSPPVVWFSSLKSTR